MSNKFNGYWIYCKDNSTLYNYDAVSISAPYMYDVDLKTRIFNTTNINGLEIVPNFIFKEIVCDIDGNTPGIDSIGAGIVEEELLSVIIANI